MHSLRIQLQRTPRMLIVGDQTITIESERATLQESAGEATPVESTPETPTSNFGDASPVTMPAEPSLQGRNGSKASSTASILANPEQKTVTPLAQSSAIPVLSSVTHEVVTPEEIGFCGPSEEELSDLKQLLINAADQINDLRQIQRQSLEEMQGVAVELASAAASFLVGYAIDRDVFAIDDLIRKALHQLDADQPVRVRLNPADHELLKTLMKEPENARVLKDVSCIDDDSLNRGGCRVEAGRQVLVTDMHSRLEDIHRAWLEKLDDSQIERRGDGSAARALRRFPDRRETA
ncbi:MAG: FliH/SctL family protein [Planctomycetota bacterium]